MKISRVAIGAVFGVVFVGGNAWLIKHAREKHLREQQERKPIVVPARDRADEGLHLDTVIDRTPGSRTIHLKLGGGEALLVLADPDAAADADVSFGEGSLVAPNRESGAKFVDRIADWLETDVPASRADQTPLAPIPIKYVLLAKAEGDQPETSKLFLQVPGLDAEVFLNLLPGGQRATLLEKDEEYRSDLVEFFATALRDGMPPRRSVANDPSIGSDDALISELTPIAETGEHMVFAADGSILGGRGSALVRWLDPSRAPTIVATYDLEVTQIDPAPRGSFVAVTITKREDPNVYSSADPRRVVLWDAASGAKHEIATAEERCSSVVWSPDASKIALDLAHGQGGASKSIVRVIDAATRRVLATTDPVLDVSPNRWAGDGILLLNHSVGSDGSLLRHDYLWQGTEVPPVAQTEPPAYASPDARFTLRIAGGGLSVSGKAGESAKVFHGRTKADRSAIEDVGAGRVSFVGRHGLVFRSDETYVLDLETLKLRILCQRKGITFHESSMDGLRALFVADDAKHGFLATVR